jgi:nucleoside-diphosphate kinase
MSELTLAIIKPDAVAKGAIGDILSRVEKRGLKIVSAKLMQLSQEQAHYFYQEHEGKPFFEKLVNFMMSGPSMVFVAQGEGAIAAWRGMMGATDPAKYEPGSIRADYAENVTINAVHGSDSKESAVREIDFFFHPSEVFAERG